MINYNSPTHLSPLTIVSDSQYLFFDNPLDIFCRRLKRLIIFVFRNGGRYMNAFDKVIGYESIKKELLQICDMIHNFASYEKLGAKMPRGVLLYGAPGLGKSLMAECFIEESGLPAYILRRDVGGDKFSNKITETFEQAKQNSPSIVLLDDMDKFSETGSRLSDSEEFVTIQSCIDNVKKDDVFVFATANRIDKMPRSLLRSGRFDRMYELNPPHDKDAEEIIKYYLSQKRVSEDVVYNDIAKMLNYSSCADLEKIINEAAISAAYQGKDSIEMSDIVKSVLHLLYDQDDDLPKKDKDELKETAMHEAGHIVVSEAIKLGSVGLASIRSQSESELGGFVHLCSKSDNRRSEILIALAGKVATEMYYSETCASGCSSDLIKAVSLIRAGVTYNGTCGLNFINVSSRDKSPSESYLNNVENVIHSELEKSIFKTRQILIQNRDFLEKCAQQLLEKETLFYSDIANIRDSVTVSKAIV